MSNFDPQAFLDMTTDDALVKRPPLPVGDYTAVIGEPVSREWVGKQDSSKSGIAVDLPLTIEVPANIQSELGLSTPTITLKAGIMLDTTPNGGLDTAPGKNGGLRKWRDATDLNKPGEKFAIRMLTGRVVKVKLGHREYNGDLFEEVTGVAKA